MKLRIFVIAGLMSLRVFGQEQRKPFQLSRFIGDTLHAAEREYYGLFHKVIGFQAAVFYLNADSSLDAEVFFTDYGKESITVGRQSITLSSLQNYLIEKDKVRIKEQEANAADVVLFLRNGQKLKGELLSVRDSSIVLSKPFRGLKNDSTICLSAFSVRSQEIEKVIIVGKSRVLSGMGYGALVGAGAGIVIGIADGDDPPCPPDAWVCFPRYSAGAKAFIAGFGLGVLGTGIGAIVGAVSSTADKEIEPRENYDFSALKPRARYSAFEPEFLRKMK